MDRRRQSRPAQSRARCELIEPRRLLSTTPTVVDLLAVYTPGAASANGGGAALTQLLQDSVDQMNKALIDSEISLTVRLVHAEQISYAGSNNLALDRQRLRNPTDGFMDSVHALRNTWGADLVTLITDGPSISGGSSDLMTSISDPNNPTLAFSAIAEASVGPGYLAIAHELGHNLGAANERGNPSQPLVGVFDYAYGYRYRGTDGAVYFDLMSYSYPPDISLPLYANPNISFAGAPVGKPIGDPNAADLASTFAITGPIVAGYRTANVVADTAGPTASLYAINRNGSSLDFTVRYVDATGINLGTLDSGDVTVTGPGGFVLPGTFVSMDHPTTGGAFRYATYHVTLPATNPATSALSFNLKANSVRDINNNAAAAQTLAKNAVHQSSSSYAWAQDLAALASNATRTDYGAVDADASDHVYKFSLASPATVSARLTGMTGDADFFIARDANNDGVFQDSERLKDGFEAPTIDEGIALPNLAAGTYFVWIYRITDTPYALSLSAYTDITPPTATLDATDLKTSGAPYLQFSITYSDDHDVDGETALYWAGADIDAVLTGGGAFNFFYYPEQSLNVTGAGNAPSKTVYYRIFAPNSSTGFTSAQNGTYTVSILENSGTDPRVHDGAGNNIPLLTLGSFKIAIGSADTTAPTAALDAKPPVPGQTTWDFNVIYKDNVALNGTTVGNTDIRVTGPSAFNQLASLVSLTAAPTIGSARIATYRVTAPGGFWDGTDDGSYTIALQANEVRDTANLAVPAATLGTVASASPNLIAQAPAGTVAFNGTGAGDTLRFWSDSNFVYYTLNGQSLWYVPKASVTRAVASGLAGNDTFTFDDGTFTGVVSGGAGDNTLAVNNPGTTLILDSATGSGSDLRVNIADGATVRMASGGNIMLIAKTLSIAPTGHLDLTNNDLVVNSGNFSDIYNAVIAGFAGSTAISNTTDGSQILGLFDNSLIGMPTWEGTPIGANAIVGKYTYFGDANFDGQVTGDDYTIIDSNLNTTPPPGMGWLSGDMNLDGIVTGDDYITIDSNLNLGVGNPLSASSLAAAQPGNSSPLPLLRNDDLLQ